jgi:predicted hydrolase (HD superfamily)
MTNQIPPLLSHPVPSRDAAWSLLTEFTQSPSLLKHALTVESCVRAYGEQQAGRLALTDEAAASMIQLYSATGLLHDFDYERHPSAEEHPWVGVRILEERGWPQEIRHAILGHAEYTGTPRLSHLDKTLFACDELAGFLTACALIRPSKSIHEVEIPGVRKKLKDKAFARGVNRGDVLNGAAELGIDLDQHIAFCLRAMQHDAEALGLSGLPK